MGFETFCVQHGATKKWRNWNLLRALRKYKWPVSGQAYQKVFLLGEYCPNCQNKSQKMKTSSYENIEQGQV